MPLGVNNQHKPGKLKRINRKIAKAESKGQTNRVNRLTDRRDTAKAARREHHGARRDARRDARGPLPPQSPPSFGTAEARPPGEMTKVPIGGNFKRPTAGDSPGAGGGWKRPMQQGVTPPQGMETGGAPGGMIGGGNQEGLLALIQAILSGTGQMPMAGVNPLVMPMPGAMPGGVPGRPDIARPVGPGGGVQGQYGGPMPGGMPQGGGGGHVGPPSQFFF